MSSPHQHHPMAREHLLPALETALTSLLFSAGGLTAETTECGPNLSQRTRCVITAHARVADPAAASDVLSYLRSHLHDDSAPTVTLKLAEITIEGPARASVLFLRN